MRSGQRNLQQEAGAETRAGAYDVNRLNMQNKLALAGLTRGQQNTSATQAANDYSGSVKQGQSPWSTIAGMGLSAAPISL